jgi:hypothetical protein
MQYTTDGKSRQRRGLFLLSCLLLSSVLAFCACAITPVPRPDMTEISEDMPKRLCADVARLTLPSPSRRATNVESLNRAADYIALEFGKTGCSVEKQSFPVDGKTYMNIICSFGPAEGERIIVGAHYDVSDSRCGQARKVKGKDICPFGPATYESVDYQKGDQPGADDNASGVAGILELARMVGERKPALDHRIDFVAYTLEEPPFFKMAVDKESNMGSYHHAKCLHDRNIRVKLMMSLEMIGYFTEEYPDFPLDFLYPHEGTYIAVVGKWEQHLAVSRVRNLMAAKRTADVVSITAPSFLYALYLSDHINYWHFDYPAVMVTDMAYLRNTNYHKTSDAIDTLNFNKMAGVVEAVYSAIIKY